MYLSCYDLDIKYSEVRKALQNSNEMHRTVMSAFADNIGDTPRSTMGILYHLSLLKKGYKLYVSSLVKPTNKMPKGFNAVAGSPKDMVVVFKNLCEDTILCFSIIATPAKKIKVEGSKNSRRVFLTDEQERYDWLKSKAKQNGFEILSASQEYHVENKIKDGAGFASTYFKGVLKINDKEKFSYAYNNGIGAGKAFGCGMLLLSKL